jgi:DNA-binding FadR family transcriptional regulator
MKRELGPEGVGKRILEEAAAGWAILRRLPNTLDSLEGAAVAMRKNAEAQAGQEKLWGMFWSGLTLGAVLVLFVWLAVRH